MGTWSSADIEVLAPADIIDIAVALPDGSTPKTINIWSVVVDGRLYARSFGAVGTGWYRAALESRRGRISSGELTVDVAFAEVDDEQVKSAIDAVYRAKYAGTPYEDDMATEPVRSNTVEITPGA